MDRVVIPADASDGGALLTIAYRGTAYSGWERQGKGEDTIRGRLEAALADAFGREVSVTAAGRTDAGVHAAALPVLVPAPLPISVDSLPGALNARLPEDIVVRCARAVPVGFHPRHDALGKTYVYNIWRESSVPPFWQPYAWRCSPDLDLAQLAVAARVLSGRHDYSAFGRAGRPIHDPVRDVRMRVASRGSLTTIWAESKGFLYKMVRALAGTMVEVARGAMPIAELNRIIERGDAAMLAAQQSGNAPNMAAAPIGADATLGQSMERKISIGPSAPAHGLTLVEVRFDWGVVRATDFIDLLPVHP